MFRLFPQYTPSFRPLLDGIRAVFGRSAQTSGKKTLQNHPPHASHLADHGVPQANRRGLDNSKANCVVNNFALYWAENSAIAKCLLPDVLNVSAVERIEVRHETIACHLCPSPGHYYRHFRLFDLAHHFIPLADNRRGAESARIARHSDRYPRPTWHPPHLRQQSP